MREIKITTLKKKSGQDPGLNVNLQAEQLTIKNENQLDGNLKL